MTGFGAAQKQRAAAAVRRAAQRGTLSHALLFSGGGDRLALARYAAAAMECQKPGEQPCGVCPACRKVLQDIHPDVITVRDAEHKNVAVEIVRSIRSDAYIRPNEGARKVYIFPDCGALSPADQNVLLKVVEEGPPYAAFLFCAENPAAMLQTLRSRCVELKLSPQEGEEAAPPEEVLTLSRAILSRRRGAAAETAVRLERQRLDREALTALLDGCRDVFASALLERYGAAPESDGETAALAREAAKRLTKGQIMRTIEVLQKYREACAYNVGVSLVLGALAVELEDIP